MTTQSKTLSNLATVLTREAGEIREWLRPGAAKVAGLILVAIVIVGTAITLGYPLLAHPQGAPGYLADLLLSFCARGTVCTFEGIYPSFSLMVLVFVTTCAFLGIILHMYAHRWDPDLDEMDTYIKAIDNRLDELEGLIRKDIDMDEDALNIRIAQNGTREG